MQMFRKKECFLFGSGRLDLQARMKPYAMSYGIYDFSVCRHEGNIVCQMRQMVHACRACADT
jgi:hypothetical protein